LAEFLKQIELEEMASSASRRARSESLQREAQREGRNKRRPNRNTSAAQSRQRLNGLIDELLQLIPEKEKRLVNAQQGLIVSRTEKLEMAVDILKQLAAGSRGYQKGWLRSFTAPLLLVCQWWDAPHCMAHALGKIINLPSPLRDLDPGSDPRQGDKRVTPIIKLISTGNI
jgi:hypothetical protein